MRAERIGGTYSALIVRRSGSLGALLGGLTLLTIAVLLALAGGAAAQTSAISPLAPTNGFLVFTQGDAELSSGDIEGTVAMGRDLLITGAFGRAATLTPGLYAPRAGSPPVSFYIGRRVNFGLSTGQRVTVSNGWIALGDASNAALFNNGTLRVVPAGGTVDSTPQLLVNANQPVDQTGLPTPPIDFTAAFAQLNQNSAAIATCPASGVTLTDANGTTIYDPNNIPAGVQVYVTLTPGQTNVLNLDVANLLRIGSITYRTAPSATNPLVVNVAGSGSFTWAVPNQAGASSTTAPYTFWNITGVPTLTMQGGDSLEGTLYAPSTTLIDLSSANIEGAVVTAEHHQGVAGSNGGEVHNFPFVGTIDCAATPPTTTTTTTTTTVPPTTTTTSTTTTTTTPTTSTTSTTVVPTSTTDPGTTTTAISPTSVAQSTTTTTDPTLPATGSDSRTLLLAALTIAGIGCLVFAATTFPAPE
jgi:choice-of-anchor A domain-containing protein